MNSACQLCGSAQFLVSSSYKGCLVYRDGVIKSTGRYSPGQAPDLAASAS